MPIPMNISDLIGQLAAQTQQSSTGIDQIQQQLTANMQSAQTLFGQADQQGMTAAQETQDAGAQQADITAKKQAKLEATQKLFGTDPTEANNYIAQELAKQRAAEAAYEPARAEYNNLTEQSLLDNPIGFIMGRLRLPSVAAKVNDLADAEEQSQQRILNATTAQAAVNSATTANTADMERQQLSLQAKAAADAARAQVMRQEGQNQVQMSVMLLDKMKANNVQIDNFRSLVGLEIQQVNTEINRENAAANRASAQSNADLRREMMQEKLDATKEKKQQIDELNGYLETTSKVFGRSTPWTVDSLKLMPPAERARILDAATSQNLGPDPISASEFYLSKADPRFVRTAGGASMFDMAQKLRDQGTDFVKAAMANPAYANLPKGELAKKSAEAYQSTLVDSTSANGPHDLLSGYWSRNFNPYVANVKSFNGAIDGTSDLQFMKNNLFKQATDQLIKSGATQGRDNLDGDQIQQALKSIAIDVSNRKVTPQEAAAHISAYFSGATEYQRSLSHYTWFGLPAQTRYGVKIDGQKYDLMNPASVENFVSKQARNAVIDRSVPFTLLDENGAY
jgi:hypothetical protein